MGVVVMEINRQLVTYCFLSDSLGNELIPPSVKRQPSGVASPSLSKVSPEEVSLGVDCMQGIFLQLEYTLSSQLEAQME